MIRLPTNFYRTLITFSASLLTKRILAEKLINICSVSYYKHELFALLIDSEHRERSLVIET